MARQVAVLPDGSNCPHSATCLRHRLITVAASVATSVLVTLIAGCAWSWNGLGVQVKYRTVAPAAEAPDHPAPATTPK